MVVVGLCAVLFKKSLKLTCYSKTYFKSDNGIDWASFGCWYVYTTLIWCIVGMRCLTHNGLVLMVVVERWKGCRWLNNTLVGRRILECAFQMLDLCSPSPLLWTTYHASYLLCMQVSGTKHWSCKEGLIECRTRNYQELVPHVRSHYTNCERWL